MFRLQYFINYFSLVILETIVILPSVSGGSCWANYDPESGKCTALVHMNVPLEDCCIRNGFSYTNKKMTTEQVFRFMLTGGGVPGCVPCSSVVENICEGIECDRDQQCVDIGDQPRCVCQPDCSDVDSGMPVCGSNRRVYRDECSLRLNRCQNKEDVELAYYGFCEASCEHVDCVHGVCLEGISGLPYCLDCVDECNEDEVQGTVCGMDNNTYESECHLRLTSCLNRVAIPKRHNGRCKESRNCSSVLCMEGRKCVMGSGPICSDCNIGQCHGDRYPTMIFCGSDDVTYSNICVMKRAICDTRRYITKRHFGPCAKELNGNITDGETFFRKYLSFFHNEPVSAPVTTDLIRRLTTENGADDIDEATQEIGQQEGIDD